MRMNVLRTVFFLPSFLLLLFCRQLASQQEAPKPTPGVIVQGATKPQSQGAPAPASPTLGRPKVHNIGDVVRTLAFSPDGKWLATASEYGTRITIWNAQTGGIERQLPGYSTEAPGNAQEQEEMSRTNVGKFLRTIVPTITPYVVQTLIFSPDGSRLASVDRQGSVKAWDFRDGTPIYTEKPQGGSAFLTYSADGKVWAAGVVPPGESSKMRIEVHDAATGKLIRTIPTQWPALLALRATFHEILASVCEDWGEEGGCLRESIHIWNLASGELKKDYPADEKANPLDSFSPDGRLMARIEDTGTKLLDLLSGEVKCSFALQNPPVIAVFSPDSREIAFTEHPWLVGSNYHSQVIELQSTATCAVIETLRVQGNSESTWGLPQAAFTADGKRLAAAPYTFERIDMGTGAITSERLVKIWDLTTGRELLTLGGEKR